MKIWNKGEILTQYISEEVANKLNDLLAMMFKANSFCDNVAYSLDCELECQLASNIYHQKFAHAFPSDMFADKLSETMIYSNIRPIRKSFSGDSEIYENIVIAFRENSKMIKGLHDSISSLIEDLEIDSTNKQIVLVLEEILLSAQALLKQSFIWEEKAEDYFQHDDVRNFNIHFGEFTTLI